jgi:hypothetical protein
MVMAILSVFAERAPPPGGARLSVIRGGFTVIGSRPGTGRGRLRTSMNTLASARGDDEQRRLLAEAQAVFVPVLA